MKSKIKNFQIQTRLGSGSYGVIFKAINKSDKSQCVLKQIKMNKMSEKAKKSTLNQATIMGKLIHPFIVQYKESFVQDDTLNIVMQYCDNGDLSMFLKIQNKKPLKQQKIWKFFIQICLGLEYIHKNKILHRDIKTLNIFLNKNQDVKIGDLGVAKMLMANDFAQTVVGTPFYLSPQLCQQKPYNQKSDIWAMGCLLYELCTYKHPFEAANQASLILKIIRGKYSPIPQFYSKQLKDMIDMCLQRDYKRRPNANMILQRPKIRQLINEYKLQEKIKQEYEKMKANKENKHPQQSADSQLNKINNVKKANEKNFAQKIKQNADQKNQNGKKPIQCLNQQKIQPKKMSEQKKVAINSSQKKPTVSGMPEKNIILPDKNKILQKLQPGNLINQFKKQKQQPIVIIKNQQNQKRIKQSKQEFLKNLEKVIEQNASYKKSPIKKQQKAEQISLSTVVQQKSRLQKIDQKIQQQLKRQRQIEKQKIANERKKSETPNLIPSKGQYKLQSRNPLIGEHKSVPALSSKESSKQAGRYQKNPLKQPENPLIPPLPPKSKQQIIKIKMQQPPIAPKVFDINKSSQAKSKGIIKSRGFTQQIQQEGPGINKVQEKKNDFKQGRISSGNIIKPVLFGLEQQSEEKATLGIRKDLSNKQVTSQLVPKASQYHSQRNIKATQQITGANSRIENKKQPQRYLFKKKPQGANSAISRVRKGSSSNQLSRNAKNVSKYNEVTKQDEDVVMNLPDSLRHKQADSSDQQQQQEHQIKMNKHFKLKDINNDIVLQKYEQILSSKSISNDQDNQRSLTISASQVQSKKAQKQKYSPVRINKNLNQYDQSQEHKHIGYAQQKISDSEVQRLMMEPSIYISVSEDKFQEIQQNQSLALKNQQLQDQTDQILDESEQMIYCQQKQLNQDEAQRPENEGIEQQIYEVNNFNLNNSQDQNQQNHQNQQQSCEINKSANQMLFRQSHHSSEWSFDQEPELPMLQDKQSPFFEEANPYLISQQEEQTIQEKRNYLQIRLEQNIKREDQINKLMQIKIQECKSMVPKYFDQILQFFRTKINKEDEYNEDDEKQVEDFLRKKGLTDQRKFQNIYKIMHFEMELENTRKIIQRICKKLGALDDQNE